MALFYNKNGKLLPITSNAVNLTIEEIQEALDEIKSKIPSTTNSTDNQLVNQVYVKDAISNVHTHDNKEVLDKISEDTDKDRLKFDSQVYLAEGDVPETATKAIGDSEGNNIVETYATKSELENKVDKVTGKSLSTNDYTTDEKTKLANLVNIKASVSGTTLSLSW